MNYEIISKHRTELMGIATAGVLLCHIRECFEIHHVPVPGIIVLLSRLIVVGDLFIMLSGFGLYYSYMKSPDLKSFYRKRFVRTLPAYFIVAVPYWVIVDFIKGREPFYEFLKDLFFISFFEDGTSIFWYVCAAFVFALIFPILWFFLFGNGFSHIRSTGLKVCLLIIIAAAIDTLCIRYIPWWKNIVIMTGRLPAFIIGIYLGYKSYLKEDIPLYVLLLVPGLQILVHFLYRIPALENLLNRLNIHYLDTILCLLFFEILLIYFTYIDFSVISGIFGWLGHITLEVYMFHMSLLTLLGNPSNIYLYVLFCIITPIAAGWALHCLLEKRKSAAHFSS